MLSKIEWTDRSDWNALRGCTRESPGCVNCYAERIAARFSKPGQPFEGFAERTSKGPRWTGRIELVEDRLNLPMTWKRPARIFANSMSDPFHPDVDDETVDKLFAVMELAHWHEYQVLTKRPDRMCTYAQARWPLQNVWLGTSVEDGKRARERIPALQDTSAAVRFLSAEPLLEPLGYFPLDGIHQVIVGGESGPGARCWPGFYAEARRIRDRCKGAGVAFFMKQTQGARKSAMPPIPDDLAIREFPR